MTVLVSLSAQAFTVGASTLGPFVTPAGNGLRVKISRTGLPAGQLMTATPWFSFDNQATWKQQFTASLVGGVMFQKDGTTVILFTQVEAQWQRDAAGTLLVPTHIKVEQAVQSPFTAATLFVETT